MLLCIAAKVSDDSDRSPLVDNIWAMMIVWSIREKFVRTVLCYIMYYNSAQWYAHT